MYPVKNPARDTRTRILPSTAWTIIKLVVVCLVTVSVPYALYVRVDSKESIAAVTVQAAERGKPYFNFKDGRKMRVDYRGEQNLTAALQTGQAQPRSLASTVLRDAAVPDLIAGYAYNGMGIVTVQYGNPDAFAPKDESVYARMQQGYNPDSLLPGADTYLVPESPDFLQVGDFNHDNRKDVLIAGGAGNLFLLPGDGLGRLNAAEQIFLPGRVTALAAVEFRASDGWTDVAIGVETPAGPALLIYDGDPGLSGEPMSFQLSAPATSVQIAGLDNDPFMDVAVAAGSEVNIIHGWGRKHEVTLESRRERISLNNNARDLAAGFFIWNRAGSNQIAVLSDDGTVSVLDQSGADSRPFTIKEMAQKRLSRRIVQKQTPVDVEAIVGWQANNAASWNSAREFSAGSSLASAPASQSLLQRSHVSFHETDDLLMLNGNQNKVDFVRQIDSSSAAQSQSISTQGDLTTISLDASEAPVAVLALPQKLNGERNLVMLQKGSSSLILVPQAPTATPLVDRLDDPVGAGLAGASVCDGDPGNNNCSVRGAVQVANANAGSTITIPSGNYVLSSNGTVAGGCDGNTVGDLGVNQGTTIIGAGAGSTIIRQSGTGPANNGDRVMCMNEGFLVGISYSFSGFTVHGGRDSGGLGGGGIIGGEQNNSLVLSGVTISNNQVTGGNLGGGGIQITGGNLTVTNCLIGGTLVPVLGDRNNVARGNINNTSTAGGLYFSPSAPTHDPSVGNLVVTGTTISNNHAFGTGGGGATSEINAFVSPGGIGTGTATYDTTTFNANQASNGGGLLVSSLPTTLGSVAGTVSFTSNTATAFGGGVHVGGGSLHINGTLATINFASSNTAGGGGPALGGGSVSANGPLTLSGTNTTIGGTAGVFTNGTWTNNNGSAMSPTNFAIVGGTLTCNDSTINVSGNFGIGPEATKGGILNAGSGTINIQGNLNVNLNNGGSGAVGQFNAGTGTFTFNGSAAQSITNSGAIAITFNNLTDSNITAPLTANSGFGVGGSLNVNGANAIFDPVAAAVISGTGTLTGTGTARVRRTVATADFNSQYTISNKTLTNLTVEYIGSSAQVLSAITYGPLKINNASGVNLAVGTSTVNSLLTLTTGALGVGTQTLVINAGTSVGTGSITSGATGLVNYNQGSAGQNVIAANYGNLTFSAFTKILASSGTIGVAGTFNPNGVTSGHAIAGSTFDFNGAGAQTVPVFNFNNLTISAARGGATVTMAAGTIGVAATFNPSATAVVYGIAGNTFDFNGAGTQTIPAFNFNNLTVSNTHGANAVTLVNGGTIGVAGTFTPGSSVFTNTGNTMDFNGTGVQTIPAFNFNNLTVSNTHGGNTVTLVNGGTIGVAGTFTPGTSIFATAGNTMDFNGGGAQTVSAFNYNNLTISGNRGGQAVTLAGGNIGIAGIFNPSVTNNTFVTTGNTVVFNGSALQTIPAFSFNGLTINDSGGANLSGNVAVDGALTLIAGALGVGANTLTLNGAVSATAGSLTSGTTGTVNYNQGSNGQATVLATNYGNLTFSNFSKTLAGSGTIGVAGTFTPGSGTGHTITGSTINFNGAGPQSIPGFTYNNLSSSGGGFARILDPVNIIKIAGVFTPGADVYTITGSTIEYNGTVAQTLPASGFNTYNNLILNNLAGTTGFAGLTVQGLLEVRAGTFTSASTFNNVQINSGATLAGTNATTMNVSGNWANNGAFNGNGNTVAFNGAAAQTIGGTTATTFSNLTINNTLGAHVTGVTLLVNATVNGLLTLTSSDLATGAFTLTMPNTATSGPATNASDVVGNVKRTGFVSGGSALSFGNPFNTIQINSGTAPTEIDVLLAKNAPATYAAAVQRSYTITPTGGSGITATVRLHYRQSELNGNDDTSIANFNLRRFNGSAWQAVVPTSRNTGVPEDNWLENNAVTSFSEWTFANLAPTAAGGIVRGILSDSNGKPVEGAVVRLGGDQTRKTITDAKGRYHFDNLQANGFYTVTPSRANYNFNPSNRSFNQSANETEAGFGGIFTGDNANPLDTAEYFVRQQYVDILGREPDEGGFNYWSDEILRCGSDAACVNKRRRDVAAAFFIEQEFQDSGSYIYDLYKSSLGRRPVFAEYSADRKQVVGGPALDTQKAAFAESFVQRAEFVAKYQSHTTSETFVDALLQNVKQSSGVDLASQRDNLLAAYNGGGSMTQGRAQVMRAVADNAVLKQAEYNGAFVLTEYFSYLRRDPEPEGYAFWLNVVTNGDVGNYRGMVCSFITSAEYQQRFSANVTHTNGECGN